VHGHIGHCARGFFCAALDSAPPDLMLPSMFATVTLTTGLMPRMCMRADARRVAVVRAG